MERTSVSLEEFRRWALLDENADRDYELINGQIIEITPKATSYVGLPSLIVFPVYMFCREHGLLCYTSGAKGAYDILGNVIAPDFAFKPTPMSDEYPDPEPPLWAVEIISPTDKATDVRAKRGIYLRAGILYWEIYPQSRNVDVYAPGQSVKTVRADGTLDGGDVLPGFTLPLSALFPQA